VQSELELIRSANPVDMAAADEWSASELAPLCRQRVMEAIDSGATVLAMDSVDRARPARPWQIALLAGVVVLAAVALPYWLLGPGGRADVTNRVPVELGTDYVWPTGGRSGSAGDLAAAFASEVLGWTHATLTVEPGIDSAGTVWVRIQEPERTGLSVATTPVPGGGRAITQVGSPPLIEIAAPAESGVSIRPSEGAVTGDISVRLLGSTKTLGYRLNATDFGGRFTTPDINDALQIATVLIRYRDANGAVISAAGGQYASEPPLSAAPTQDEILADGVVTRTEFQAAAQAVVDCLNQMGYTASIGLGVGGGASFNVMGGEDTADQAFSSCHGEHMGRIELIWADQNAPSPEREMAFYNAVVDCVEAQTGESYGDVGAVGSTKATDAALDAAPDIYMACFDDMIDWYPDGSSGG